MFDQLNKPQVMFIYQDPSFWFVIALMVYTSATLFLFIEADHLPKAMRRSVWKIAVFANIIKNILFSIAFAIKKPTNLDVSLQHTYEENSYENPYT